MEIKHFFNLIREKKQTVFSIVVLVLAITVVLTMVQTFKYEAKSRLIVIQEFEQGVDPYAISKSNEYLSGLLANVISANTFFNQVMAANPEINRIYFQDTINKQMRIWQNTVEARSINDTGIIEIKVYHPDKNQALMIINAIATVLQKSHGQYHGAPNKVSLKILDEPIVSRWPVKPNPITNGLFGLGLGIVAGCSFVYAFPGRKYDLRIWPRKKTNWSENDIIFTRPQTDWASIKEVLEKKNKENISKLYQRKAMPEKEPDEPKNFSEASQKRQTNRQELGSEDKPQKSHAEEIIKGGNMKNIIG